jgi:hypothetical protein
MHIEVSSPVIAGCAVCAALVSLIAWTIYVRLKSAPSPSMELALAEHRIEHLTLALSISAAAMSPAEKAQHETQLRELEQELPALQRAARRYELKKQLRDLKKQAKSIDEDIADAQGRSADPTFLLISRDNNQREIQELNRELHKKTA